MQKTGAEAFTRSGTCLFFKLAVSFFGESPLVGPLLGHLQEPFQFLAADRMLKLFHSFRFDLANPFSSYSKDPTDLF